MFQCLLILTLTAPKVVADPLPSAATACLDSLFPGWKQIEYGSEYYGLTPTKRIRPAVFACYLNSDTIGDFAVGFTAKKKSKIMDFYAALVSVGDGYELHVLSKLTLPKEINGRIDILVEKAGNPIAFFGDKPGTRRLKNDAVCLVPMSGCCATTHYYDEKSKKFKWFTSGD